MKMLLNINISNSVWKAFWHIPPAVGNKLLHNNNTLSNLMCFIVLANNRGKKSLYLYLQV